LGATFFGASLILATRRIYRENIAEHARVPTRSFIGYICKFAIHPLPAFALISILFFSR